MEHGRVGLGRIRQGRARNKVLSGKALSGGVGRGLVFIFREGKMNMRKEKAVRRSKETIVNLTRDEARRGMER